MQRRRKPIGKFISVFIRFIRAKDLDPGRSRRSPIYLPLKLNHFHPKPAKSRSSGVHTRVV
jgi:hypothetical protein